MIQQSTLDFLKKLKENNEKTWFQEHRDEYERAREDFVHFFDEFASDIVELDDHIIHSQNDSHILRINRDIRFSPDKTLYKSRLGWFICPRGRANKHTTALYYLHVSPWNTFLAVWVRAPERKYLENIRDFIAEKWNQLQKIINKKEFKKIFWTLSQNEALKTAPRWYPIDHKYIELLRLKHFTALYRIPDSVVTSKDFPKKLQQASKAAKPFNDFFNSISAH